MVDTDEILFIGAVVKSTAGRDKHRVFIVYEVRYTENYLLVAVADGSLRSMTKKKYKNPCHIKIIGQLTNEEMNILRENPDDETVKRLISIYDCRKKA